MAPAPRASAVPQADVPATRRRARTDVAMPAAAVRREPAPRLAAKAAVAVRPAAANRAAAASSASAAPAAPATRLRARTAAATPRASARLPKILLLAVPAA